MPELPDLSVYIEALERFAGGATLGKLRVVSPFVLRSVDPPAAALEGRRLLGLGLLGKRLVFTFEDDLHLVLHLMIAGRLRWRQPGTAPGRPNGLAALDFGGGPGPPGTLVLTEASKKKRASLHVVRGREALDEFDRGGLDVRAAGPEAFAERLARENRTLKRALTDPRIFAGIGNAYSDEILHRARMSPVQRTHNLGPTEVERLRIATLECLDEWTTRLRDEVGAGFPDKVTAFRPEMAVHGRFRQPCPVCGSPVQRIRFADNEMNYCPGCQTDGRLLADRGLSRLLKGDWPKTLEELEARLGRDQAADDNR